MFDAFDPAWFAPGLVPGLAPSPQAGYNNQMAVQQAMAPVPPVWMAPPVPHVAPSLISAFSSLFGSANASFGAPGGAGNALPEGFTPAPPTVSLPPPPPPPAPVDWMMYFI